MPSTDTVFRVFTVGTTNTSDFLTTYFGNNTAYINTLEAAYPASSFPTPYDQAAAIFTDFIFQCAQAKWANDTAAIGAPAWRYYFNASFVNTQSYPDLGVFHSSEIPLVFGTRMHVNTTTQEYALSRSMMGAWARFAKNPMGGPGWNQVGSGAAGSVLVGASEMQAGGVYMSNNGSVIPGAWDLGLWGNRGDVMSGGVTVIDQYEVDYRCGLYTPVYELLAGTSGSS